jgi:pilus assembly protein CpaE
LHVLLVCPNRSTRADLTRLLSQKLPNGSVQDHASYPTRSTLAECLSSKPSVCLIEMNSDREKAMALLSDLAESQPSLLIVAVLAGNDPDLILRCLRQGASEFLASPFTDEQFLHVLERISQLQPSSLGPDKSSARVIAIFAAKGACGASTVAANLAHHYRRAGAKRVLLADLDPLTGVISFLLKIGSNYSFLDVLSRAYALDADIWNGIVSSSQGIDLLLSPENPIDAQGELRDASPIVSFSRHLYDTIILDTHNAYGDWNLSIAREADDLLLITTNELASLQAAQKVLGYFERNHIDRGKVHLVVNRFQDGGLRQNVIEAALECDVYQTIPDESEALHKALVEGKPVSAGSGIGRSLKELADRISGHSEVEPAKKPSSLAGFLSIFSRSS